MVIDTVVQPNADSNAGSNADSNPGSTSEPDAAAIGTKVGRGLRWSLVGILVTKMASFLIGLVLARILTPADFGVFAIAMALTAFLIHVNDAGVIASVVQWRGRIEEMAATAALLAVTFSAAVYAVVWFIAPWFARAASSPHATWVIRILAGVIVIDGITAVRSAALLRRFQQDKLTLANLFGFIVQAPLSIVMALAGDGAYSFAVAQLVGAAVTGAFIFYYGRVRPEAGVDREVMRKLLRFGLPLAASLGVEAILVNADYIIVGHLLGDTQLGFYLLAFNVSSWIPGIVTTGVRYVSIAGFSRLAEQEESALTRGVTSTFPPLIGLVLPITIVTVVLSPQLVHFLYGATWAPAAPVLQFLMVLTAARIATSFIFDILTSAAATRSTLWLNLVWAVVLIPALYFGTHHDGIRGTSIAHAVVAVVIAVPLSLFLLRRAGVRLSSMGPVFLRLAGAGAVSAGVCVLIDAALPSVDWLQLVLAGGVSVIVYVLLAVPRPVLMRLARRGSSSSADGPPEDTALATAVVASAALGPVATAIGPADAAAETAPLSRVVLGEAVAASAGDRERRHGH